MIRCHPFLPLLSLFLYFFISLFLHIPLPLSPRVILIILIFNISNCKFRPSPDMRTFSLKPVRLNGLWTKLIGPLLWALATMSCWFRQENDTFMSINLNVTHSPYFSSLELSLLRHHWNYLPSFSVLNWTYSISPLFLIPLLIFFFFSLSFLLLVYLFSTSLLLLLALLILLLLSL